MRLQIFGDIEQDFQELEDRAKEFSNR